MKWYEIIFLIAFIISYLNCFLSCCIGVDYNYDDSLAIQEMENRMKEIRRESTVYIVA